MTRRVIHVLTAALFVLATAGPLAAQSGEQLLPGTEEANTRVGTRGANFLSMSVGARAVSLGGAFGAAADDASALYWNPAGIALNPRFTALFSYNDMYGDFGLNHFFGGVTLPMGDGSVGFSVTTFTSGDIPRTTEAYPEGGDPQFGDTFQWTALAVGLTYARQITDRLVVGATLKYAQNGIDDAKANFYGGDAGVTFRTGLLGTTLGATLLNVGSDGKYSGTLLNSILTGASEVFDTDKTVPTTLKTQGWDMPTAFTFSVMWDVVGSPDAIVAPNPNHNLILMTDAVDAIDTAVQLRMGLEYGYRETFFLRAGKMWPNENQDEFRDFAYGLGGGFGLAIPLGERRLILDYAYQDRGLLDNIQVFTVEYTAR
ncbi:MAG: PorV/PorQ family protein [Gemmatimonadales bacterium]|jgi:hypothetical protein